jgi:hypothetical protein
MNAPWIARPWRVQIDQQQVDALIEDRGLKAPCSKTIAPRGGSLYFPERESPKARRFDDC